MKIGDACTRIVYVIGEHESALDAAKLMRELHVGDLVIVHRRAGGVNVPTGIVTDRDLTLEVLAQEVDPESVSVGDLFTNAPLYCVTVDEDTESALDGMRQRGVRRLPVLARDGSLAGIMTMDDFVDLLADEMADMAGLMARQKQLEVHMR